MDTDVYQVSSIPPPLPGAQIKHVTGVHHMKESYTWLIKLQYDLDSIQRGAADQMPVVFLPETSDVECVADNRYLQLALRIFFFFRTL